MRTPVSMMYAVTLLAVVVYVYVVVTRLELPRLKERIDRIDPQAFVVNHGLDDTKGGMIKARPLH